MWDKGWTAAAALGMMLPGDVSASDLAAADAAVNSGQVGMGVFFVGMATNIYSDHILRSLRKEGEKGYKIPYGGMFEYVSGANFFGEAVEWSGFAIMCGTLPAAAFALFTVCNIGPRAYQHHRWYLEKFEDYPKNRKAIIPFIL
nr:hypothetical protein BaRGS_007438 [Batillaria attramentaria]